MSLLNVRDINCGNWETRISFHLSRGENCLLLGRNGAGKTTLLTTIAGMNPISAGKLEIEGLDVTALDEKGRIASGVRIALEGRQLFHSLSVRKNLLMGAYVLKNKSDVDKKIKWILDIFPDLKEKIDELAGTLSGGQQTMLNLGRALVGMPKLLLLDEPALGLDPDTMKRLIDMIKLINKDFNVSTIIAEQLPAFTHSFPDRILLLAGGRILHDGTLKEMHESRKFDSIFI
jgi:branched-chain amino acid transport system ATP-binding protein